MTDSAHALIEGNSIRTQLDKLNAQANADAKNAIAEFQQKLSALLGGPGGPATPSQEVTLTRLNGEIGGLYQQIWQVDAEPTAAQIEALAAAARSSADLLKRWNEFKSTDLPALNQKLRQSQTPEIRVEADLNHEELEVDEE